MKNRLPLLALSALGAWQSCFAAVDVPAYIASQGWGVYESKVRLRVPVDDLAAVMYYAKGSNVPSCGLLTAGKAFIEILEASEGEEYPHCLNINDAAAFTLAGRQYLVFEYSSRETRGETTDEFFYVYKDGGDYQPDARLNDGASARRGARAVDGIRRARMQKPAK